MQGLATLLYPLVLMLFALGMERLENRVTRGSGAVSPDQVDSLLTDPRARDTRRDDVASVAVLPTTGESAASARRAS
ncbi:hypothetical protein HUN08_01630 [Gordonia sp. X0973]|uniref:hypothetical protein n=1 Tax=Gordonia sp. X0973 TaxID=2742602 RepID=UPI000F544827|nr:hypothetical protein [Gordonia sp. X0973]QKT06032.1 hypothetical protein HUN08_01630 [Gordonia sp. X0973]